GHMMYLRDGDRVDLHSHIPPSSIALRGSSLSGSDKGNALAAHPIFQSRLSLKRIEEAVHSIDPVFLNTPQFLSEQLSGALGMRLVLKVETVNPIRSFKGRGADYFVS